MLKKKTKLVVLLIALIVLVSSISFATDDVAPTADTNTVNTSENTEATAENQDGTTSETPEIHNGDLYLFGDNVVMDKLVDGNVFILGNNVQITGRVNGSLFVAGNKVTFEKDTYIVQSIYVASNELILNGSANDLYACASKVDMSYDSFMIRDLRVFANTFNFSGGVGRDAFVETNNFNFTTEGNQAAIVYGNLNYTASNELNLGDEFVQGETHYSKYSAYDENHNIVLDLLVSFCETVLYTAVVFLLLAWLAPKFVAKSNEFVGTKSLLGLAFGALTIIVTFVVSLLLLISSVGASIGVAIFALLILMISLAFTVTAICITYKIKEHFKFEKKYFTIITLFAVTLVLWILKQIPYVGPVISVLIALVGLGIIVMYIFNNIKKSKEIVEEN